MKATPKVYGNIKFEYRDAYFYYKKNYVASDIYRIKHIRKYRPVFYALLKEIADQVTESKAGVFIPKFGYIATVMMPYSRVVLFWGKDKKKSKRIYNEGTDNKVYTISYFSNLVKNTKFRYWGLDKGFSTYIKQRLKNNLWLGKRYELKYTLLKKLLLGQETRTKEQIAERRQNKSEN